MMGFKIFQPLVLSVLLIWTSTLTSHADKAPKMSFFPIQSDDTDLESFETALMLNPFDLRLNTPERRAFEARQVGVPSVYAHATSILWKNHNPRSLGTHIQGRLLELYNFVSKNPTTTVFDQLITSGFISENWMTNIYDQIMIVNLASLPGPYSRKLSRHFDMAIPATHISSAMIAGGFLSRNQPAMDQKYKVRLAKYLRNVLSRNPSLNYEDQQMISQLLMVAELNGLVDFNRPELKRTKILLAKAYILAAAKLKSDSDVTFSTEYEDYVSNNFLVVGGKQKLDPLAQLIALMMPKKYGSSYTSEPKWMQKLLSGLDRKKVFNDEEFMAASQALEFVRKSYLSKRPKVQNEKLIQDPAASPDRKVRKNNPCSKHF